jgi:hypothetical protein
MLFNRFVMAIWRWWELLPRRLRPADPPARVQHAFDAAGECILRAELPTQQERT